MPRVSNKLGAPGTFTHTGEELDARILSILRIQLEEGLRNQTAISDCIHDVYQNSALEKYQR